MAKKQLPASGVFYVRGGYGNIRNWKPVGSEPEAGRGLLRATTIIRATRIRRSARGCWREEINAIAASPYWSQSAIIITYDESDGLYDHAQPRIRSHDANGLPLEQGPRIPAIVISPYAVAHGVSHVPSEHSSIIKFVDQLFNLIPLADLPDEMRARQIGMDKFGQPNLGPADDGVPGVGDMTSAFDTLRLQGKSKPLSAEYATIPAAEISSFPHAGGAGCKQLEIKPTDSGIAESCAGGLQSAAGYDAGDTYSGRVDAIVRGWVGISALALAAFAASGVSCAAETAQTNETTLARVRAAGVLRCGIDVEEAEYTTSDDHGNREAFDADLCHAVAVAVLGKNAQVRVTRYPDDADAMHGLNGDEVEMVATLPDDFSHAVGTHLALTRPVLWDGVGFLALNRKHGDCGRGS